MKYFLFSSLLFISSALLAQEEVETVIQRGHELAVIAVAASPDSNYIVTGSRDKSAKLWELHSGREVRSFLGHDFSVPSTAISSDGKYLLTGSNDETARLWDITKIG